MQYRYIEFKDKLGYHKETDGKLWYVGEPTEELIKELELKELKIKFNFRSRRKSIPICFICILLPTVCCRTN